MRIAVFLTFMLLIASTQQSTAQQETRREGALILTMVLVEGWAFGTGAISTLDSGPLAVAVIDGVAGAAVLIGPLVYSISDRSVSYRETAWPQFTVPYSLGLLALGYYNLVYAPDQTPKERFWKNVIGFNAVVLVSAVSAAILKNDRLVSFRVSIPLQ